MAQLNDSIVRGILKGSGVTRWEVEQLCHRWLQTSTTTPQPGAEALRELIAEWKARSGVTDAYKICADELESLLARGGK